VYPAGEARIAGADSKSLMKALGKSTSVQVVEDLQEIPAALSGLLQDGDVLITMGAGSISKLPQMLVENSHG
jgi:UDP-N-acetylmuramate--alanine ligase